MNARTAILAATVVSLLAPQAIGTPAVAEPPNDAAYEAAATPPAVKDVRLKRGYHSLRVSWDTAPKPVKNYRVQTSAKGGPWKWAATTTSRAVWLKGLNHVETRVRVRVWTGSQFGKWSKTVASTPANPKYKDRLFKTRAPGSPLVPARYCAARARPADEIRPSNGRYNRRRGTDRNDVFARVAGGFIGTTDEILQWTACKWGAPEYVVKAQAVTESWWDQRAGGDLTNKKSWCHPSLRDPLPCPGSIGIFQILYRVHPEAYEDRNAIRSTAYNADYLWALWRSCYEGEMTWLNSVERGKRYKAGDTWGCVGVMNAGRWYTDSARDYIQRVKVHLRARTWRQPSFTGSGAAGLGGVSPDELGIQAQLVVTDS